MEHPEYRDAKLIRRPLRIAFIVDPHNSNILNQLYKFYLFAMKRWGGRFYALVPLLNSDLTNAAGCLLRACDPDYVISYVQLSPKLMQKIRDIISPIEIYILEEDQSITSFVDPETCLKIPSHISKQFSLQESKIFYQLVGNDIFDNDRKKFLAINFGFYPDELIIDKCFERTSKYKISISEASLNISEYLTKIINLSQKPIFPLDIIQEYSIPAYKHKSNNLTEQLHVVVGDTSCEFLYVWNRVYSSSGMLGRDIIWIPSEFLTDENLVCAIGQWINFCYINKRKIGSVLSFTHTEKELEKFSKILQHACENKILFDKGKLSLEEMPIIFQGAKWNIPRNDFSSFNPFIYSFPTEQSSTISIPVPPLPLSITSEVNYCSLSSMVDCIIEHKPSNFSNVQEWIKVPQKNRVADLFFSSLFLQESRCRINSLGIPSLLVRNQDNHFQMSLPNLTQLLEQYSYSDSNPQIKKFNFKISEEGRKLLYLTQIFGSLDSLIAFLYDPFLFRLAEVLSGLRNPKRQEKNNERLLELLEATENKDSKLNLLNEHKELDLGKRNYLTYEELHNEFINLLKEHKENDIFCNYWRNNQDFKNMLYKLEALQQKGILLQGIEQKCPYCFSKAWYKVTENDILKCECGKQFKISFNPDWCYKLNYLIIEALKKNSYIHVARFLYELKRDIVENGDSSFMWEPSLDIFLDKESDRLTDLDLLLLKNGRLCIGEVKSNFKRYNSRTFEILYKVIKLIQPDIMFICAIGKEWPSEILELIKKFTDQLENENIRTRIIKMLLPPIKIWEAEKLSKQLCNNLK